MPPPRTLITIAVALIVDSAEAAGSGSSSPQS